MNKFRYKLFVEDEDGDKEIITIASDYDPEIFKINNQLGAMYSFQIGDCQEFVKLIKFEVLSMDFSEALRMLRLGKRLQRHGWNGTGMYIQIQKPDENSKMTLPYIFMKTATDELVPWLASQSDILENDWEIYEKSSATKE